MGEKFDRVYRSFAPKLGMVEDSVCGSGHCHLVPFWQKRLVKVRSQHFRCQIEVARSVCNIRDDGKAVLYAVSKLFL
ncbi:PhzF family phenazine biosynthesis protein [Campylobacter concisus]|uniref:PhzF family phenazine biosynthesis protein n=1 Tax=Campylobacter concisus TaxID=199 RepID=UPI0018846F8F|nr:PhzF family phenazine biosynthesis protein [Campylobacter concisus]MBE9852639.1 PhzF family phenazine biosynthesis protein [Campylobacter concisus]